MLTISKPLSADQAQTYHKEEFANAQSVARPENCRPALARWIIEGLPVTRARPVKR
jgi:hypothetical protein